MNHSAVSTQVGSVGLRFRLADLIARVGRFPLSIHQLLFRLAIAGVFLASRAHAAGTAYGVDTAEVGEVGNCKIESWLSWASNQDFIGVTNPSCVVDLSRPVLGYVKSVEQQEVQKEARWNLWAPAKSQWGENQDGQD